MVSSDMFELPFLNMVVDGTCLSDAAAVHDLAGAAAKPIAQAVAGYRFVLIGGHGGDSVMQLWVCEPVRSRRARFRTRIAKEVSAIRFLLACCGYEFLDGDGRAAENRVPLVEDGGELGELVIAGPCLGDGLG